MSPRHVPVYWSSCCGALADYIGYYRCAGCQGALSLGRGQGPHLVSTHAEAAAIRDAAQSAPTSGSAG